MKLFKNWFLVKRTFDRMDREIEDVSGILSEEQIERAEMWYGTHKNHVNKLYHKAESSFYPSLLEDKNDPRLWKAGHWKWYLDNFG